MGGGWAAIPAATIPEHHLRRDCGGNLRILLGKSMDDFPAETRSLNVLLAQWAANANAGQTKTSPSSVTIAIDIEVETAVFLDILVSQTITTFDDVGGIV